MIYDSYKNSITINRYKETMRRLLYLYNPNIKQNDIEEVLNYSINKRLNNTNSSISNSYLRYKDENGNYVDRIQEATLLDIADYIRRREPILTSQGTMFKHHEEVPNPLAKTIQSFLDMRGIHKKEMFKYPKGSESFEKYNLLQQLDKIDCNGIYGALGMYTSLIFNINVASSITAQGRSLISAATMQFEMFLNNNVKFGSLNQVLQFIDNVISERFIRKFNDDDIIDNNISLENVFAKIIFTCGYRWIPTTREMEIIWNVLSNLDRYDLNRIYYKNNLFEFVNNSKVISIVETILKKLKQPLLNSLDIPEEINDDIKYFSDLLMEYVYYRYQIIDRIDRCENMIKSIVMVSDTDSTIISLDGWYRYIAEYMNGKELTIANYYNNPVVTEKDNEPKKRKRYDYNFATDEIIEKEFYDDPTKLNPNQNVRYSIINILAYVLDKVINDYMIELCKSNNTVIDEYNQIGNHKLNRNCKILMKNEFTFLRLMMTTVKKNYASLIAVQEGKIVPEEKQLDVKGIECFVKATKSSDTRERLKKILLEDILKADNIDQLQIIKDIAVFEREIINDVKSGSKKYFKPATIKSISNYDDPMRIQGIKASIVWNKLKDSDLPSINLNERNAINIINIKLNDNIIESKKDENPELYNKVQELFKIPEFKHNVDTIALPLDVEVPEWLKDFIDYSTIVENNISGFPYESVGIQRFDKSHINYTNIVKL